MAANGSLAALVLVGLAILGRGVTPVEADGLTVLTPAAQAAANLSRQARAETERLQRDASELRALLASPAPPDPLQALLLAQRLYAAHRLGASATAGARQALTLAPERSSGARVLAGGHDRRGLRPDLGAAL